MSQHDLYNGLPPMRTPSATAEEAAAALVALARQQPSPLPTITEAPPQAPVRMPRTSGRIPDGPANDPSTSALAMSLRTPSSSVVQPQRLESQITAAPQAPVRMPRTSRHISDGPANDPSTSALASSVVQPRRLESQFTAAASAASTQGVAQVRTASTNSFPPPPQTEVTFTALLVTYVMTISGFGHDKSFHRAKKIDQNNRETDIIIRHIQPDKCQGYLRKEGPYINYFKRNPNTCQSIVTPSTMIRDPHVLGQSCGYKTDGVFLVYDTQIDGDCLNTYFKDRPFSYNEVRNVFRQIVDIFKQFHMCGFAVGTIKLESAFISQDGKIRVFALPVPMQVTSPGIIAVNNHRNVHLTRNTRIAFKNDIVIIGYILGYIATGNRPRIISSRKLVGGIWVRHNTIMFSNIDNLPFELKNLLSDCLNAAISLPEIMSHQFVTQTTSEPVSKRVCHM
jgi:hypothetical protein